MMENDGINLCLWLRPTRSDRQQAEQFQGAAEAINETALRSLGRNRLAACPRSRNITQSSWRISQFVDKWTPNLEYYDCTLLLNRVCDHIQAQLHVTQDVRS